MKTLKIGEKEYALEFTFEAAEHKELVQSMFNVMSCAYIVRNEDETNETAAMINGVAEMVADVPRICRIAFYAGLLENSPVSEVEAKELMKQYMKDNKLSYNKLFEELKECMGDDGFFDLSGLAEVIQSIEKNVSDVVKEEKEKAKKAPKKPQDHKKSTSTK